MGRIMRVLKLTPQARGYQLLIYFFTLDLSFGASECQNADLLYNALFPYMCYGVPEMPRCLRILLHNSIMAGAENSALN